MNDSRSYYAEQLLPVLRHEACTCDETEMRVKRGRGRAIEVKGNETKGKKKRRARFAGVDR
jgi:hypothetical protein